MKKIVGLFLVIGIAVIIVAGLKMYSHYCEKELREVDRYALPAVIEFMEALDGWNFENIKPYLTDAYIASLTEEEWKDEFEKLSTLGALKSFARPHFISHQAFIKYKVCPSAMDLYSVASEFEKDNAVIRIFFENNCGKLKVSSFLVNSESINVIPENEEQNDSEVYKQSIEELSEDEDIDLDSMYELDQENAPLTGNDDEVVSEQKQIDNTHVKEIKKRPQGKAYRY